MMNEYVGTALFLGIGIVVTYYQAKCMNTTQIRIFK